MFQRILVGFDGSESSRRALESACTLAVEANASLLVLTVVQPPEAPELESEVDAVVRRIDAAHAEGIRWAKQRIRHAGVQATFKRQVGHPADVLVRTAEEGGFDLIVLGRRGHSPITHWLLGSTTDRVVDHAPCALLIVH